MGIINKKTLAVAICALSLSLPGFAQSFTLNANKITVKQAMDALQQQTGYSFVFYASDLDVNKQISIQANNVSLQEAVRQILEGQKDLTYRIEDKRIIVKHATPQTSQPATKQNGKRHTVKGKVVDGKGEPIIGATVIVKGSKVATVTDVDGNYVLQDVPENARLVFSSLGFASKELGSKSGTLDVSLGEDQQVLNEVVVVGYGIQKKVDLTGAVSSVKGDDLTLRPVTDASQSLQGLVPGLLVTNGSAGRPGATGTLTLRGQGNLSGTGTPYVLVDGIEMSLSDVNPNDIESISVLKDAAACAIYGARAAYGVILVTTKQGVEGKMRVNYQGTVGWSAPTVLPEMANAVDFTTFWNDGVTNANSSRRYSDEKIALLKQYMKDPTSVDPWQELDPTASMNPAFENSEKGIGNVDYFKLHYKDYAFKQRHNLSLSGGGKAAQYYVSGGYLKEDGILRYAKMNFERMNLSTTISSELTKWLKLKMGMKFTHSVSHSPFGDGGLSEGFYHSLARFRPTISVVDPHGHFTELSMIPYLQSGTYTTNKRDLFDLQPSLILTPIKGLTINFDYTYKYVANNYDALNVAPLIYGADGVSTSKGARSELGVAKDGRYTRYNTHTHYQSINLYGTYLFSFNKQHNFTVMGGYQEEDNHYDYLRNSITGLYSTKNPNVSMGTGDKTVTDVRNGWATRGFFGRINYDYENKYLLQVDGRYDGSSRFAKGHRWGFFPSVSAGWNITEEKFMEPLTKVLSHLKIRGSIGRLGNQSGAALYTFASTMSLSGGLGGYYFADGRHMYLNAPGVVNPATTWEKVNSKNLGLDFALFNNTLTGSFDIFQRTTKDMLGPGVDFPDFFGASAPQTNNASMRNRGWELVLNYRGKIAHQVDYQVGFSISDATAVVTDYANPTGTNPESNWYTGKKVGEIWGYRTDGILQTQEQADEYNKTHDNSYLTPQKWTPGDVAFRDLNGDKKVNKGTNVLGDMGDYAVIGNTTPRYQYTLNGAVSWKGITLSVMFQGIGKRDWDPTGSVYFWGSSSYAQVTVFKEHLDYWTEDNKNAYYPKPYINSAGAVGKYNAKTSGEPTDRYLQNAAYCRLKNLTLSYDLPASLIGKFNLQQVRVFFSGENLFTITKLKGMFDPESIFTSNGYTGEGGKNYPMNRVLSVGLTVSL